MAKKTGTVYLVGAGPGNPELITVRGRKLLESCDSIIYDYLIHSALLRLAVRAKDKIYVGRKGPAKRPNQEAINKLMIKLAREGKNIVRLKGGDPLIFGRGGEEALALRQNKIPYEIVPGVTAAFGGAAYAGIPLTHRAYASDITFITAQEDPSKQDSDLNWEAIAKLKGTLVIYMGTRALPKIAKTLIRYGKKKTTPVAVIRWVTTGNQKTVIGTLETISDDIKKAKLEPPTIIMVGEVVKLRKQIRWFEEKPLFGKTILVTRAHSQAGGLRDELQNEGARVIEFPTIEIKEIEDKTKLDLALHHIEDYDWIVLTSENGVSAFVNRLKQMNMDARDLKSVKIAVVGSTTEKKLNEFALRADLVPPVFSTEGLLREFKEQGQITGKKFLLLRSDIAPQILVDGIEKEGGRVTDISVYKTTKPSISLAEFREFFKKENIDCVTFTSSSAAQNFFSILPKSERKRLKPKLISIGPVTSETIKGFGAKPYAEANPHNLEGLIQAARESLQNGKH